MKRLFKIFSLVLLALLALGLGLVIFIRVQYPSERLKQILLATLSQRYGITATCERLSFNLFSGFVLEKIKLVEVAGRRESLPADFISPLAIEKIDLSYRWRALLARRLEIDAVTISQPTLRYWQAPDSSNNLEAWLAAFTDSAHTAADTAALPISINLKDFRLLDLNLRAMLVSAADTQHVALEHVHAEISQLEVDRRSRYRAQFKLFAAPLRAAYRLHPRDTAEAMRFSVALPVQITGHVRGDSLAAHFEASLAEGQWDFGAQKIVLPFCRAQGEVQYHFISSALQIPALQFHLTDALALAGSFSMKTLPDTAFAIHLAHGEIDLEKLSALLQAQPDFEIFLEWQNWRSAGKLEIRDSYFRQNQNGRQYRGELKGEQISLSHAVSKFALDGAKVKLKWETSPKDSARGNSELFCDLSFSACDVPLDSQNVLATGPAQLHAHVALTPDYLPVQGDFDLSWQNFSAGNIHARARFAKVMQPALSASVKTFLQIDLDSLPLSTLTENNLSGRLLHANLKIAGDRLDDLQLTGALHNDSLTYSTEESFGKIPPYDLRLSARIKADTAFSEVAFSEGSLQFAPMQMAFQGAYDLRKNTLRLELPNAQAALAEVIKILPQEIIADTTFPFIAGTVQARGWLESRVLPTGQLKYDGKFFAHLNDGVYADTLSGVFAENLRLASEWTLATDSTIGEYRVDCPALRLDYLPAPLPPATVDGKIVIYADRFLIQAGKMEIPAWSTHGNYGVVGKFLAEGMQVTTTVAAEMQAQGRLVLNPAVWVQGRMKTNFVWDQYLPDDLTAPQPGHIAGRLELANFDFARDSSLALRGLNVQANFAQEFDLLDFSLPPTPSSTNMAPANAGEALLLADILGEAPIENEAESSRLSLAELQYGGYQFKNIAANLALGNGRLELTQIRMNLFEGNLIGNLLLGLGEGNPDHVTYSLSAQLAGIDVSRFRQLGAQVEKGSKLSADFSLSGAGASTEKIDEVLAHLGGACNISKIEKRVASNLLQALDPKGTDVGVQRMRLLLKTGWNVKTMKFEIKNGFVYASLSLVKTKPWTALFNLPPTLDFARFPLRYFMKTE